MNSSCNPSSARSRGSRQVVPEGAEAKMGSAPPARPNRPRDQLWCGSAPNLWCGLVQWSKFEDFGAAYDGLPRRDLNDDGSLRQMAAPRCRELEFPIHRSGVRVPSGVPAIFTKQIATLHAGGGAEKNPAPELSATKPADHVVRFRARFENAAVLPTLTAAILNRVAARFEERSRLRAQNLGAGNLVAEASVSQDVKCSPSATCSCHRHIQLRAARSCTGRARGSD